MNPSGFYVDPLFSYIDLLNYMLKYKIPQIVTLTHFLIQKYSVILNHVIPEHFHCML